MPKKKATKKSAKKPEAPQKVLRRIDANTVIMSDDPSFPPVEEETYTLPKGMVQVDAHTIIKAK